MTVLNFLWPIVGFVKLAMMCDWFRKRRTTLLERLEIPNIGWWWERRWIWTINSCSCAPCSHCISKILKCWALFQPKVYFVCVCWNRNSWNLRKNNIQICLIVTSQEYIQICLIIEPKSCLLNALFKTEKNGRQISTFEFSSHWAC